MGCCTAKPVPRTNDTPVNNTNNMNAKSLQKTQHPGPTTNPNGYTA